MVQPRVDVELGANTGLAVEHGLGAAFNKQLRGELVTEARERQHSAHKLTRQPQRRVSRLTGKARRVGVHRAPPALLTERQLEAEARLLLAQTLDEVVAARLSRHVNRRTVLRHEAGAYHRGRVA